MRPIDADALIDASANYRCGLYGVRREAVEKFIWTEKRLPKAGKRICGASYCSAG